MKFHDADFADLSDIPLGQNPMLSEVLTDVVRKTNLANAGIDHAKLLGHLLAGLRD